MKLTPQKAHTVSSEGKPVQHDGPCGAQAKPDEKCEDGFESERREDEGFDPAKNRIKLLLPTR
jgi:hypothetical protein